CFQMSSDKITKSFRVVVLADLHDHEFGKENDELVKKIAGQNPDLILMAGDMINGSSKDAHIAVGLVRKLSSYASIYYALGNHEIEYSNIMGDEYIKELEDAGAVVLDQEYEDIEIQGNKIRIGAMYDYAFSLTDKEEEYHNQDSYKFLSDFTDTRYFKIYITHRPEAFAWSIGEGKDNWDMDVVFSGHIHGGQVVLPFLGGLYGAEQGWFPDYVDGKYQLGTSVFFVTRGLGSNVQLLPRMFNLPQIMVVTINGK
ncbi:MAG: metallophosphoesterase, partial [Lachnospiraceae bacterium]|nr:metallophosphoesterase [Lachnospiraceae bacterium]